MPARRTAAAATSTSTSTSSWDPYDRGCPSRGLLDRIGDKWSILVIGELGRHGTVRFNQLRRRLEGVSEKMLAQTLRALERDGLVLRTVHAEVPVRVEYELTALGQTLREPLRRLTEWSTEHTTDVLAARERYDTPEGEAG